MLHKTPTTSLDNATTYELTEKTLVGQPGSTREARIPLIQKYAGQPGGIFQLAHALREAGHTQTINGTFGRWLLPKGFVTLYREQHTR